MPGLQNLLEDYKNFRGRQEWETGRLMDRIHPQMEEAMNLWGGFDTGGLAGAVDVLHGTYKQTPFPKFDLSHLFSGEGAAAYSRGHYFTEQPKIAKHYAERGPMGIPVNPMFYRKSNIPPELEKSNLYQTLSRHIGSPVDWAKGNIKSINRIKKWLGKYVDIPGHPIGHIDDIQKALYQYGPTRMRSYPSYIDAVSTDEMMEALRNTNPELYQKYVDEPDASSELIKLLKQVPGDVVGPNHSIYDVSLEWPGAKELIDPLAREHFYQWDLPFSKQPEEIQKILSSVKSERPDILPKLSGISQLFKDTVSTPYENSLERELYRRGVPGTAYYDAYSRKRGMSDAERKFNYVIWGDEIPNIKAHNNPSTLEKMWPKRKR